MELPTFRYHPDPLATGAIERKPCECACCGRQSEYTYVASVYGPSRVRERLCPWCIADGAANETLEVEFVDSLPHSEANVDPETIREVTHRTPGYISWQQEVWLSHCGDACAFLGDAAPDVLRDLSAGEAKVVLDESGYDSLEALLRDYEPGGQPAVYHFKCLHCGANQFGVDYT